jgi:hypothetical protein
MKRDSHASPKRERGNPYRGHSSDEHLFAEILLSIRVFEVTPELAREASDGWNNAGTGHAGLCELSYTPAREPDGSVKIGRALSIFEQFEHSNRRQFLNSVAGCHSRRSPVSAVLRAGNRGFG